MIVHDITSCIIVDFKFESRGYPMAGELENLNQSNFRESFKY